MIHMLTRTFNPIPLFESWIGFTGNIPDIYWNVYSDEQRYLFLCKRLQRLVEYAEQMGIAINANAHEISLLAEELAMFKAEFADEFEEYYKERICQWLQTNLACMIGNAVKFVQFGLSENGYFQAYITNNWDFLEFDTIMQAGDDFGKLKIVY